MKSPNHLNVQAYARVAGVLFLLSMIGGGFGEAYVPSKIIVSNDAAATAANIKAFAFLFRLGFVGFLLESVCDTTLSLNFYVLLKPVNKHLALLAAFFGLVGTAIFAVTELFYFMALYWLSDAAYLKTFQTDQLQTLALLSLKYYIYGSALFTVYYGLAWIVRSYLIFRSGYLPKLVGVLMAIGGLGFVARNLLLVLAPAYASGMLLMLLVPGALLLAGWLIFPGVDIIKWNERTTWTTA
ncbi:MAG: hypothetical protein QOH88_2218 [Verrucomicrobiota bacterium]|jgi:hypothetical protein